VTTQRPLSRRQFLRRALVTSSAIALVSLVAPPPPAVHAQALRPIAVRVADLVQETRSDFATGQPEGVELPRVGGGSGVTAGPEGGVFTSGVLETEFPASHVGVHWQSDGGSLSFELRTSRDGARWSRWQPLSIEAGKDETPRGETFGALVSARGARLLQYRVAFPPGDRTAELWRVTLTYLDAQPRGRPAAESVGFAGLLAGPAGFRAQIVPREAWGADESLRFAVDGGEIWPRANGSSGR